MRLDLRHFHRGILLYLFVLLTACAQLGLVPPQTFNQKWSYAMGSVTSVRLTAKDLLDKGVITRQDAINTQDKSDNARKLLDAAWTANNSGDVATAEGKLSTATALLTELQNFLRSKGGGPT